MNIRTFLIKIQSNLKEKFKKIFGVNVCLNQMERVLLDSVLKNTTRSKKKIFKQLLTKVSLISSLEFLRRLLKEMDDFLKLEKRETVVITPPKNSEKVSKKVPISEKLMILVNQLLIRIKEWLRTNKEVAFLLLAILGLLFALIDSYLKIKKLEASLARQSEKLRELEKTIRMISNGEEFEIFEL